MTRLTPDMISNVPRSLVKRDADLVSDLDMTLKDLAYRSVGIGPHDLVMEGFVAASVPVSSGKGITGGFSESVCSILEHLGMSAFTTRRPDVAGLSDAVAAKADIIFMADDEEFVALNRHAGKAVNNTRSTALGYVTALKKAVGGLNGKDVLLIGAGRVGSCAAELLVRENARVTVFDIDRERAKAHQNKFDGLRACSDLREAMLGSMMIFNASPATIPGEWVREGAVISSPGMPFSFDEAGIDKARTIIHDPLQLGVSVMAVWSASLTMLRAPISLSNAVGLEVY